MTKTIRLRSNLAKFTITINDERSGVKNSLGRFVPCRILLDTCATAHFVTEEFVKVLGLPTRPCSIQIGAISDMHTTSNGTIELFIHSLYDAFKKKLSFLIVPKIAERIPDVVFPRESINIPVNLNLADPQFHVPRSVDMIIGSGATLSLLSIGQINLSRDNCDLFLQKTQLGWVVVGGVVATGGKPIVSCKLTELTEQIAKFWLLDDITAKQSRLSDNSECEIHYTQNTTRDSSGRYVVRLPFRSPENDFGNSRSIALRRFHNLQKKLNANPTLKQEYERVMSEYIDLDQMSLIPDDSESGYYLPHHAVTKSTSTTTKVRVVFDASAKTNRGLSLNDTLMVGPTIQCKLFEHLSRFRMHKYVLTADIEKMYRQIWMHPDDRKYQKIFWHRENRVLHVSIKHRDLRRVIRSVSRHSNDTTARGR